MAFIIVSIVAQDRYQLELGTLIEFQLSEAHFREHFLLLILSDASIKQLFNQLLSRDL